MPRNPGTGTYTYPDGTPGIPNQTVFSARYNTFINDLANTLNQKLPVNMGGTGADDAAEARDNIDAEVAGAQVTDYNTHVWEFGSFFSEVGATNPPVTGHAFSGIVYGSNANNLVVEARSRTDPAPGRVFVREKEGGIWEPTWKLDGSERFVELTGDTMSGALVIAGASPHAILALDKATTAGINSVVGRLAGIYRWEMRLGDTGAAADLGIYRYNDAGTVIDMPFSINRATGILTLTSSMTALAKGHKIGNLGGNFATGALVPADANIIYYDAGSNNWSGCGCDTSGNFWIRTGISGTAAAAVYVDPSRNVHLSTAPTQPPHATRKDYVDTQVALKVAKTGDTMTGSLSINMAGPSLNLNATTPVNGAIIYGTLNGLARWGQFLMDGAAESGGNAGSNYILQCYADGGGFLRQQITCNRATGATTINGAGLTLQGNLTAPGVVCRAGMSGALRANVHNIDFLGGLASLYIDNSLMGNFAYTSDYRIKKDVVELPGTWETVKALRPIKYTQAEYTPQIEKAHALKKAADEREQAVKDGAEPKPVEELQPMFPADDIERWGFIAHELQATLIPSAATGVKDAPGVVQSPNPFTLIAALTRALQEAMARIEALEAAQATP